ncbi:hypothetical protein FRC10_000617 [Ceratobasidium sp. 414]|nr:hypothetical protein FRC10_000617 [Ceratobasidium sp. 414]
MHMKEQDRTGASVSEELCPVSHMHTPSRPPALNRPLSLMWASGQADQRGGPGASKQGLRHDDGQEGAQLAE